MPVPAFPPRSRSGVSHIDQSTRNGDNRSAPLEQFPLPLAAQLSSRQMARDITDGGADVGSRGLSLERYEDLWFRVQTPRTSPATCVSARGGGPQFIAIIE